MKRFSFLFMLSFPLVSAFEIPFLSSFMDGKTGIANSPLWTNLLAATVIFIGFSLAFSMKYVKIKRSRRNNRSDIEKEDDAINDEIKKDLHDEKKIRKADNKEKRFMEKEEKRLSKEEHKRVADEKKALADLIKLKDIYEKKVQELKAKGEDPSHHHKVNFVNESAEEVRKKERKEAEKEEKDFHHYVKRLFKYSKDLEKNNIKAHKTLLNEERFDRKEFKLHNESKQKRFNEAKKIALGIARQKFLLPGSTHREAENRNKIIGREENKFKKLEVFISKDKTSHLIREAVREEEEYMKDIGVEKVLIEEFVRGLESLKKTKKEEIERRSKIIGWLFVELRKITNSEYKIIADDKLFDELHDEIIAVSKYEDKINHNTIKSIAHDWQDEREIMKKNGKKVKAEQKKRSDNKDNNLSIVK